MSTPVNALFSCLCCLFFLGCGSASVEPREDLSDLVLILDPGHGDRAWGEVPADPGAVVQSDQGPVSECVLTWDTALRLRKLVEERGGRVYLTLESTEADQPKDWAPHSIPRPGTGDFPYRVLTDIPKPDTEGEALYSRVATANRLFRIWRWTHDVYFISLHFDSTSPDLAGISFYYPTWREQPAFSRVLESTIRKHNRPRRSLRTDVERGLSQAHAYAVLSCSDNPDAYLVELANLRSQDASGANPDLWRARSSKCRQAYAELLLEALLNRPDTGKGSLRTQVKVGCGLLLLLLLGLRVWRERMKTSAQSKKPSAAKSPTAPAT